jgi:hypothetical protein
LKNDRKTYRYSDLNVRFRVLDDIPGFYRYMAVFPPTRKEAGVDGKDPAG